LGHKRQWNGRRLNRLKELEFEKENKRMPKYKAAQEEKKQAAEPVTAVHNHDGQSARLGDSWWYGSQAATVNKPKPAIRYDLVPANGITAIAVAMTDGLKKYNKNDWVRQLTANRSEFVIDKFNHALQHILNMNVIGINREDLSHALADLAIIAEIFAF
jgi:hypothetical protein